MKFAIAALIATSYAIKLTDDDIALQKFKKIEEDVAQVQYAMGDLLVSYEEGEFDEEVTREVKEHQEAAVCDSEVDSDCEDAQDDEGDQGNEGVDGEVTDPNSATTQEAELLKQFEEMEGFDEEQKVKLDQVFVEFKSLNVPRKQVDCVVNKLLQEAGLTEPIDEDTPVPDCEQDADQTGDQDDDEEELAQVEGIFGDVFGFLGTAAKAVGGALWKAAKVVGSGVAMISCATGGVTARC